MSQTRTITDRKLYRTVAACFFGAIVLTCSLGLINLSNKRTASDEADLVSHTYVVINQLERTLEHVIDVETGARGFAATRQEQFLEPFEPARALAIQDLDSLQKLTGDDPEQMSWLRPLSDEVRASISLSEGVVSLTRKGVSSPLGTQFQRGKTLVDGIRIAIRDQQTRQGVELNRRIGQTANKRARADVAILVSTLVGLFLLALAWMAVRHALLLSSRSQLQIEYSNSELARRVEERTALLTSQAALLAKSGDALRAEGHTLQSVLDNMEEGLTAVTVRGEFTLWNRAAEKLLGTAAKNELGIEDWSQAYGLFLPDGETPCPTKDIPLVRAMGGESCDSELFIRNSGRPDGVWIEVSARTLKNEQGDLQGGLATFRDISRRKRDESQIRTLNDELEERVRLRTQQLEAANTELEAFTYSVSHDLRAPLRHISGFSRLLVEDFGNQLDPEAKRYLERITEGSRKMGILVDELLNLARVGRHVVKTEPSQLNSVVLEVISILTPEAEDRHIEWKIDDLGSVSCDPILIAQVFQNLISNALKFTRPRATAIIEIGRMEDHGRLTFFVRDNGVGFDMKYSDKLFGVFQRLHRVEEFEGTGIGLATVRRIVQKHCGKTWAQAEVGKGATFYFSVDMATSAEITPSTRDEVLLEARA